MMRYRIINPSDDCYLESDDVLAAAAACVFLGSGQYALEPQEPGGEKVPFFMFGGLDEWWGPRSPGVPLGDWIDANKPLLASVLETVTLAGRRTSLNDIAGRAKIIAKNLRGGSASGPAAPQQVFVTH